MFAVAPTELDSQWYIAEVAICDHGKCMQSEVVALPGRLMCSVANFNQALTICSEKTEQRSRRGIIKQKAELGCTVVSTHIRKVFRITDREW